MESLIELPSLGSVVGAAITISVLYVAVLALTRITGSRTLASLSGTDLATTVAIGSALASAAVRPDPSLVIGLVILTLLFTLHYALDYLRNSSSRAERILENRPLLLMRGPDVVDEHLRSGKVTLSELRVHLRAAGVRHRHQVCAVILERTGLISVLAASSDRPGLDPWLVDDVPGAGGTARGHPEAAP